MARLVVTVGTSLLTNRDDDPNAQPRPWAGRTRDADMPSIEDAVAYLATADPRLASAETHTLLLAPLNDDDRLTLLHSDTPEGRWCSSALAAAYSRTGHTVAERAIACIGYAAESFVSRGLKALIKLVFQELEEARRCEESVTLCATGGFKAETAMLNLVGILMGVRVVYVHERFRDLIELPRLPVAWDMSFVKDNLAFFEWIDEEPRPADEVERRLRGAQPELGFIVEEASDGCAYLTASGNLLYAAYRATAGAPAAAWPPTCPRMPAEKNGISREEHKRPAGWERALQELLECQYVTFVRYRRGGARTTGGSRITGRDAAAGILHVAYVADDRSLPLSVETTARGEAQLDLVERLVERILRRR